MKGKGKITVHIVPKEKERAVIPISTEFIRLDAFLKLALAVQSGGHAKLVIQDGEVFVNGELCMTRGKKLHPGDIAEFEGKEYEVVAQ